MREPVLNQLNQRTENIDNYMYVLDKFLELHKQLTCPSNFVLIAVEGPDGCGKTTIAKHLYGFFVKKHIDTRYIKDIRASELDDFVHDTLSFCHMRSVTMNGLISYLHNSLSKTIVIYDRYIYSNVVYQLLSNFQNSELNKKKIEGLVNCIISSSYFIKPNCVIYLNEVLDERKRHKYYEIHKRAFDDVFERLNKGEGVPILRPSCTFKADDLGEWIISQFLS